jgi:copper chaperone CopZ
MKLTINKLSSFLFLAALILLGACGGSTESSQEKESSDVPVTFTEEFGSEEKYVANIAIEGMACEMMCGNKIAGTLNELAGVKGTEIDFLGEGEINHALVEYDATTVSEQEMIEAVQSIASGHYKVSAVEVRHIKRGEQAEGEKESAYAPSLQYELPNVFSVFSGLF